MAFSKLRLMISCLAFLGAAPSSAQSQNSNGDEQQQRQQIAREIFAMPWIENGQGAIGGGGSSAQHLGQGSSSGGPPAGPSNPNRPADLGPDLSSIFAPFDRLGKPGDPSYVSGTGGDGQTQSGSQSGQGQNNGALTPYQQVFTDFYDYALTTLDRNYVPLSVKDFVRDYFSSLDPSN